MEGERRRKRKSGKDEEVGKSNSVPLSPVRDKAGACLCGVFINHRGPYVPPAARLGRTTTAGPTAFCVPARIPIARGESQERQRHSSRPGNYAQ
ncbi:hypothetical protein AAFF_G00420050 [Aldrovandia affinis]|uniref:Uncharacterized protein n=1 Tax=Aldrovandia affinis TaxID=143900 RepID=A0AAD7SAJ4_9TELE|nr:hypothetical protein AAFF_G00420050 [Aldrovandia affinis]